MKKKNRTIKGMFMRLGMVIGLMLWMVLTFSVIVPILYWVIWDDNWFLLFLDLCALADFGDQVDD